ncbi:hypothetical protein ARMGADRAFT_1085896 [Armillaria gallica]|uniref:Uncharacterized protein n=1 Tax=Armillaria gallica TaxID=47427 RepID=A0A2H3CZ82_ARMGA|nr:hypothetical protein ARMGADRAFT_1085896 [Armillaria gallica]
MPQPSLSDKDKDKDEFTDLPDLLPLTNDDDDYSTSSALSISSSDDTLFSDSTSPTNMDDEAAPPPPPQVPANYDSLVSDHHIPPSCVSHHPVMSNAATVEQKSCTDAPILHPGIYTIDIFNEFSEAFESFFLYKRVDPPNHQNGKTRPPYMTNKEKDLLIKHLSCFVCREFYTDHISTNCKTSNPNPATYHMFTEADTLTAKAAYEQHSKNYVAGVHFAIPDSAILTDDEAMVGNSSDESSNHEYISPSIEQALFTPHL